MNSIINNTALQPLLFDFATFSENCFYHLTTKEVEFASLWNLIVSLLPSKLFETNAIGRKGFRDYDILAIRIVMLFFKQNNVKQALSFMKSCPGVREIIGMKAIPSESVVCRRSKYLFDTVNIDALFDHVTEEYFKNSLVCNLSIDSTPIDARETPVKREKRKVQTKRGRKRKGSEEEKKQIEKQKQ